MTRLDDKKTRTSAPSRLSDSGRRTGSGRWSRAVQRLGEGWRRLLEMPSLWLVVFVVLCGWALAPRAWVFAPDVGVGMIADRDYIAPEDLLVPDDESTQARQQRARDEVLPVYDFDPEPPTSGQISTLFARGRELLEIQAKEGADAPDVSETLLAETYLKLTPEQLAILVGQGFSPELEDRVQGVVQQVFRQGVVFAKEPLLENRLRGITLRNVRSGGESTSFDLYDYLEYPDEVRELVDSELRDWMGIAPSERRSLIGLLEANLLPNLSFNQNETVLRQEAAALETSPSFSQVRRGEVIVRKGDVLDAAAVRKINSYQRDEDWSRQVLPLIGILLLLSLAALVVWLALREERDPRVAHHSRVQRFGEALLILTVSIIGAKLMFVVGEALAAAFETTPFSAARPYVYGVPFAALGLCAGLLMGRQAAFVLSVIFSLLMSRLAGPEGMWVAIYSLAGCLAAVYALDFNQVRQRLVLTRVSLVVSGINAATVLLLRALAGGGVGRELSLIGFELMCALASGIVTAAVASFAIPVFEAVLGITTDIKLAELADTNLPLLRRLAFEAPGSFQHSLMVANLAKQACESIGADASLAYTGGLYHDVGKVFRSEYFIENQRSGVNPHDKLQPTMSALVLISHVKDGVQLAKDHHLPQPILDAIEQHHGSRLIKYFYSRAKAQAGEEIGEVREEKFRYPGPKPQNKVMGVLMIADAVEAASRTLVEPSELKIRTLIRTIVEDCLQDGQLDQTDLTLSDLRLVADSFLRVLSNIFHTRVDYPGFDFNARPGSTRNGGGKSAEARSGSDGGNGRGGKKPRLAPAEAKGAGQEGGAGEAPAETASHAEEGEHPTPAEVTRETGVDAEAVGRVTEADSAETAAEGDREVKAS